MHTNQFHTSFVVDRKGVWENIFPSRLHNIAWTIVLFVFLFSRSNVKRTSLWLGRGFYCCFQCLFAASRWPHHFLSCNIVDWSSWGTYIWMRQIPSAHGLSLVIKLFLRITSIFSISNMFLLWFTGKLINQLCALTSPSQSE